MRFRSCPLHSRTMAKKKAVVVSHVQGGAFFMDLGTFIGHDLRRLMYDGVPSENLIGVDIDNHFDLGYEFFRDRDRFRGAFIQTDFLSSSSAELVALRGEIEHNPRFPAATSMGTGRSG
ncbi:hypothetical protein F4678DRAFT_425349 [Xylaria arbuscula]|nr:hypothetical protein F4678DRAFT_425349 [Xylaria arbuscula]